MNKDLNEIILPEHITNKNQCIQLINRYENITLEEIQEALCDRSVYAAAQFLTGFGEVASCIICHDTLNCDNCVLHLESVSCTSAPSNRAIANATDANELLTAYHERALVLKELLINHDINKNSL